MSCLSDDIMESVISCEIAKATWADLVHSFNGPSDTKENKIIDLKLEYQTFRAKPFESLSHTYTRYKTLLNELANDGVNLSKHEINVGFVNSLPEKWLTFSQELRNTNHTQTFGLADIYGRFNKVLDGELLTESSSKINENKNLFVPASMGYDHKMVPKSKDWVERLNPDNKLPNFNTGRILVLESQAVNESFKPTETSTDPESSKDSKAESITPLPPLKILQGASLSSESVLETVTVSETEQTTPSVHTEQESKINELTKLVQMLIDENVNSTQKTQKSKSQIQQTESSKSVDSIKMSQDSKLKVQNSGTSKILYCMICKKEDHRTSDYEMYNASLKKSENYKAQPYHYASSSKQILKAKAKPFP
ncbi:hypothetical protein Tco_0387270 [Tanacetum coccineum]